MTNNAAKRRIWLNATAVIIAVALLLSCAFAAFLYTRTGGAGTGTVAEGEGAEEVYGLSNRGYGTSIYNGETPAIPSGATRKQINSESALTNFLTEASNNPGTTYYGYLTANFKVGEKPVTNRVLPANATLDGNGYTITSEHSNLNAYNLRKINSAIGSRDSYLSWWGIDTAGGEGNYDVQIYSGVDAYGLSNVISVNYGTIKNLNTVVTRVDGGSDDIQAIYISPWNGNVMMGGIAGINFGVIYNCTMENEIKYGFIPSQYYVHGSDASHRGDISYQEFSAVGGIAGYNGVNPSDSSQTGSIYGCKVVVNDVLGLFRSEIAIRGRLAWDNYIEVPSNSITSGVVGGVAAINNGGIVSGINLYAEYRETYENYTVLYNTPRHSSKSYTGVITGITNITSSPIVLELNGQNWTFAPSTVTNITLETDYLYIKAEAHDMTDLSRGSYGVMNSAQYPETGNYAGIVCGQGTTNSNVNFVASYGGDLASAQNVNFRTWNASELNSSQPITSADIPKFGYGTNNSNDYINEITSINTRFEGQMTENNSTDLTSVGATVSYIWDAEQRSDGGWVSGLRQNINFDNVSGINAGNYFIYGTQSYVNGAPSYATGSATYESANVTYGGLAVIPSAARTAVEYDYSLLMQNFTDSAAFDAFAGVNAGANFAYAYANALVLNKAHTLDNSSASQRELRSWKTIDGGLKQITVTGLNNTAVSVDGINALSDFIAVNRGTIVNLSIAYSVARGTISASGNTAYGFVAGVNYGTIAPAVISTSAVELSGSSPTSLLYLGGAVGYNCGNMSGITQNVAGNMTVSGSAKQAFLGGVIGVNTGAGTLQTAVLNGSYDATVQATAGSTYGNYVGGFIGAGVNSGSVSTQGNVLTLTQTQADPFGNWLYSSKMRVQTNANSYTGLFAGLITASPIYNAATNPYINGLVAAAPNLDEAVGWFSPTKGVMTLAGYAAGTTGASGKYVSTDLIRGQVYTVQDASDAFVSKILTDVYWAPTTNIYRFTVTSFAYSGNWALMPYDSGYRNFVNYGSPLNSGETFATAWTYENNNNGSYAYTFDAGLYMQNNDASSNPDYLAPVVGVELIYRMNLQSGVSAGDATNADDALTLFLSGESAGFEHMNPNNGYKALCAGASGGYGDNSGDPWTVSGGRNIVFDKPYGLDGSHNGGMSISVTGDATSYAQVWDEASQSYATAEFIAVNNSSIYALKVTVDGNKTYSTGDNLAYSHLVGVNNGTISACTVTVNGNVSLSATGAAVYGSLVGINNGTVSTSSATLNGSVSVSGGGISYAGGAVGINRGVADGTVVNFDGGAIALTNSGGTLAVLGGAIGLQDSASLSDVQTTGYNSSVVLVGAGYAGGVIGLANVGNTDSVAGITATKTSLTNIANSVYAMNVNAESGYTGLISGAAADGEFASGALEGIAAIYPDEVADYAIPWTTAQANALSMYGRGTAAAAEGLLFKISDFSNDGAAEFLTERTITVNGAEKSIAFMRSQIVNMSEVTFVATYNYYDEQGDLAVDKGYAGTPTLAADVYTLAIGGGYANSSLCVPVLDLLIDYTVSISDGQVDQLVDFMRGDSDGAYASYAGAHKATLASGAAFSLDSATATLRAESSAKKILIGTGNTLTVSGTLPSAEYNGSTVTGGFFAVNRAQVINVNVVANANLSPSGDAFGLFAGVNEGELTNVGAAMYGASASVEAFGVLIGVNYADVNGSAVNVEGVYTVTSNKVFAGGAIGKNSGNVTDVTVNFNSATLTANATSIAAIGGVVGSQDGGSLTDVGTAGSDMRTTVASGTGYSGGIVGIINTGAQSGGNAQVAGESLAPTVISGVYAGVYPSAMYGGYRGLVSGATSGIASGAIEGAAAHYYENGEDGDPQIPWFTQDTGTVSMYGYSASADVSATTGVLFKVSDYSDDGNADFIVSRQLSSSAGGAEVGIDLGAFAGAYGLTIGIYYHKYEGQTLSSELLTSGSYSSSGSCLYSVDGTRVNGTGTYVPVIEFFAEYTVDISQGTENDWESGTGIENSLLFCFVDGVGANQLYAGAKKGNVTGNIVIDKPMNGYVTMREEKVLEGNGNKLMFSWVGDLNGNYTLQLGDRGNDNASSGSGGYVQTDAGRGQTGAVGGLIAVNYGTVRNFAIAHANVSGTTSGYAFYMAQKVTTGMLVGANFGTVENITYDNSTTTNSVKIRSQNGDDIIFGGIVGTNAASGTVRNFTLSEYSGVSVDGAEEAIYGGVLGANYGEAYDMNAQIGTEIAQNDYMTRLGTDPASVTDYVTVSGISIWGASVGYNAGELSGAAVKSNVNYGVNSGGASSLAAGGVVGMLDGGSASGLKATGWGGFFVYASTIRLTTVFNVYVGGLVGAANADGASEIGFVKFASAGKKATLSNSVFALSGGMVTMDSYGVGIARYGYVSGVLAASYAAIPSGAVSNTFWYIADKLREVEGDGAEIFPVFHGGNALHPTYISAFGMAPSDWLNSNDEVDNNAQFATGCYGFTMVDSDDNPINYLTMDVSIGGGVLTVTVHKPTGISAYYTMSEFSQQISSVGGNGTGSVGAGSSADQILTVSNVGASGAGYLTFSFESGVYALTDSAYVQYMILSFLSSKPCGATGNGQVVGYYSYTTVDGEYSRTVGDAFYRVYQLWSGATEMRMYGTNKTVQINATPGQALVLGKDKTFDGGQDAGYDIIVTSAFANNIELYAFGGDLDGVEQKYLVVSEFIAVNYGIFKNTDIQLSGTGEDDKNISRNALDVLANASNIGIDTTGLTGFIYGMLVGVNEGTLSDFDDYSFDRTITLDSNADAKYNSIFGGMVGAMSGEKALVSNIGHITFGTDVRAGGITMTGEANLIAAGGVVGIAIQGRIERVGVTLTANSSITVNATHNSATVGGVVGDLRGVLSDVIFESEYQSKMLISGTKSTGTAALANLVGVINTFSDESDTATIEKAKVIGIGYLYNGLDESGIVTTSSTKLYTAGVVALGSNYQTLTADSEDEFVRDIVAAYGEIRPSKLDSVYVDFEGYVRAKANTRVGLIAARLLDGITSEDGVTANAVNINWDNLKNLVWQTACEGDSMWTTNANYADYTAAFNTNSAIAVLGYAPVTIDSNNPDLRGLGMRLWLTNNLYSTRLTTSDMVTSWKGLGQLEVVVTGDLVWNELSVSAAYYDGTETDSALKYKQISALGSVSSASAATIDVDVTSALALMKGSAETFPNGIYMLRVTYNEVYIYNQTQLMTFMSSGADTTQGLLSSDADYNSYANANVGIIANDLEVNYATQGTGDKAGHYYTTAVTMRADKILEGNGYKVTITTSGTIHSAVIDDKGNTPAGALLDGEYFWDYIGGLNTLSSSDLNQINTTYSIGIRAGALFVGRNLGTIQNIAFELPNSVTIDNVDYAKWHDVITQDSWRNYGTSLFVGIVTAVNAGTIDNCTLTIGNNAKVNSLRGSADGPQLQKGYVNDLSYKVNTMSTNGGFAGLMYGTSTAPSYISNCTVTLGEGSEIRATSRSSSFSWAGRNDSVFAYAGGVVGWLTSDSTIYNVTVNGTGTMTAWGDLDAGSFSSGDKVTSAGAIVGLNSDHSTYTISNNADEYGIIDGVICNWNGAAYFLTTGNNNIFYSSSGRVNYYVGAQLAGVAEQNTLNNIYFMYGIDQYKTFHQDNWYYGDNVAARQASEDFLDKYNYVVSRAVQLLENNSFGYSAIYAIAQKPGGSASRTEVAYRNADGSVTVNLEDKVIDGKTVPAFTFENYVNYQTAVDDDSDVSGVSGATNFSLYVASGSTFYVANQYFPRITSTMDSGGDKNYDYVGARAAAMITINNTTDWNWTFKPNNVYLYEVGFGVDEDNGTELDMNDPDTSAYLSFQTKDINSDVVVNVTLKTDNLGAQFVWKTIEQWSYADGSQSRSELLYYNNVTSLEQAKQNNSFVKIFDRDNDGADFTFTYVMGMAIKIAMDENRYYYDENEGVFYDNVAKIYDGTAIDDPMLYYADEEGNRIESLGDVSASLLSPLYYKDNNMGGTVSVSKSSTDNAGAYRIRISFTSEGGENSKVNTTNRTMMFSQFDHIDIYTVVLPKTVLQSGVSVSKTYDGTANYGASSTVFANLVAGDSVALTGGSYSTANAGSGTTIFGATYINFTFRYVQNGIINQATIPVFEGTGQTSNYAPASAMLSGDLVLADGSFSSYKKPAGTYAYKGEIFREEITADDLDLYMSGQKYLIGNLNNRVYDYYSEYDTQAFEEDSVIFGQSPVYTTAGGGKYLEISGYATGEKIRFYFTFKSGTSSYESVKNYGQYDVYINIDDATNFVFAEGTQKYESLNIGMLSITEYAIETANVTYLVTAGYLSKTFDNTSAIPFTFNSANLKITAQNGYEVQPSEYTITVGAMYTTSKGGSSSSSAKDAGEYDIYFRISNFNCPLGNYTLEDMTVRFVDESGRQISYFVLPKEIRLDAVTKEFDNTVLAEAAYTDFTYSGAYAPVSGTNDMFAVEYDSVDVGAGLTIEFVDTVVVELNGNNYETVKVVSGSNQGKQNYYVAKARDNCGNITPVSVTAESVSIIYSNSTNVDYRKEGTSVVMKDSKGNVVNIYPLVRFDNKNAGTNKTVTFVTTSQTIAGKSYALLTNSTLVSQSLPTTGVGYAGNYYVSKTSWTVGEIVKNTLALEDILGNIVISQTNGKSTVGGSEYLFENLGGKSYTYHYGYYVGFEIDPSATIIEDDPLKDHLTVTITNETNEINGYAGNYTLVLEIVGTDYDWDENVQDSSRKVTNFRIDKQILNASDITAALPATVYTYTSVYRTITPSVVVTDEDGRQMSLEDGEISWLASSFSNTNPYFAGQYNNGTRLPVGDYSFSVTPVFVGDDRLNYTYTPGGSAYMLEFSIIPSSLGVIRATKEFDNTTSLNTEGNVAVFTGIQNAADPFTPSGSYVSKNSGSGIRLDLDHVTTTVNGTNYSLLVDESGRVTNNTYNESNALGTINKYTISATELNTYILGWVKDVAERQQLSLKTGAQLEYRSDEASAYGSEHFLFSVSGMSYGFTGSVASNVLTISQNSQTVASMYFAVNATSGAHTFAFAPGGGDKYVLPTGDYTVTLTLSNLNFELEQGAGNGTFTVNKQEISGGSASGSANVFIVLNEEFSYAYGEEGFNMPTVEDVKFVYTLNVIDKYTGKIGATFTQDDKVIESIEYSLTADATEFFNEIAGPLYIGGYYVWATTVADSLGNYSVPEGAKIAVYVAGTPVPEVPDPEEGEEGGQGEQVGETGDTVTIPSLPAAPAYFVLPRTLNISAIAKTYDGTVSFDGAVLTSDALAGDGITVAVLDGEYESPNANYDSTGSVYIEGNAGSDYVGIVITPVEVNGTLYNMISVQGLAGNYCIAGDATSNVVSVACAKIMRKSVDPASVKLTSDTFEKKYGDEAAPELPIVTADLAGSSETVNYDENNVVYKQGGEVVVPQAVGGYEMYLTGIAFDNYEVSGLGEVLVNEGRGASVEEGEEGSGEGAGDESGTGGDQSGAGEEGEEEPQEKPETYTYYIVPKEVVISGVVKFYDKTDEVVYYAEGEDGISAEVTVADTDGNEVLDAEGNPVILRIQAKMSGVNAGKLKDVYADFTMFGYNVNFDESNTAVYYRLLVKGEDGTENVASNYCVATSDSVLLPEQFEENYEPDPDLGYDDTPVVNNGLVYQMTFVGIGTVIPAPLTVEGIEKVYDGTYDVTQGSLTGMLAGDEQPVVARWRYDTKDAATGKIVGIETDGEVYEFGGVEYYAIYVMVGTEKVLSDYGVAAVDVTDVEETEIGEDGSETTVTYRYAVLEGAGTILPYALTAENFSNVGVAGMKSVEYSSTRYYSLSEVRATLTALGFTQAAVNTDGTLSVVFENGDELTFSASFGAGQSTAHDAATYTVVLSLVNAVNYSMATPYTFDFVITRQSLTKVYVVTGGLSKEYDGTGALPAYSTDGWVVYAVDKQGALVNVTGSGYADLSAANIVFKKFNEEEGKDEYFVPVNVTADPGYQIYVTGFEIDAANYVFTSTEDALGCAAFDEVSVLEEKAYYKITPRVVEITGDAFESKTFDGAYSLRIDGGVPGETVVVGDLSGLNASLAGTYGTLNVTPYVKDVATDDTAFNGESIAENYALYYQGAPVGSDTVVTVTDYTVSQADVLVAERDNGSYVIGVSGLQGLDFLFATSSDITEAVQSEIADTLYGGEVWSGGSFDTSSAFAKLNAAVADVFALYVNNGENAVTPSVTERYVFDDFAFTAQDGAYVLTFVFKGIDGYDGATATDRYTFVIKGVSDSVRSTNYSTTSSELESGQLNAAQAGEGVAVSTVEELREAIIQNKTFYLANSIYGADLSDVSDTVFTGSFDGRGHTLSLTGAADGATHGAAGMLVAVNDGTISNLVVKLMPGAALNAATAGGLVGINNGTISNVSAELVGDLAVTGATYAGGIVGVNQAGATITSATFVYSADVAAAGAKWGAIAGNNAGALDRVAVRVNESAGASAYAVSSAGAGFVAGNAGGSANGVIVAVANGALSGVSGLWNSGDAAAQNVYSYVVTEGAAGSALKLLDPYPEGYIGYYFATADDYTTAGTQHNVLTDASEYNKSYYVDYSDGAGFVAIEAIAPYNRFVWDGYGTSYRTAFGDSNVGSSLNRIVALFAAGDVAAQFDGTTVITSGVNAFTVAIGVRGGNVDVEGDVETSIKEVVYTGVAQIYSVNITVTSGGVSETKTLTVGGTEAGYYSKASLEGIIGGGAGGETIGDVTYDSGSRTEYTFSGEGTKVANGIALVIYPAITSADGAKAEKYYDTTDEGTLGVTYDGEEIATLGGNYYDAENVATSQAKQAEKFGFSTFGAVTREVLAKNGVLYEIVERVIGEGEDQTFTYEISPIKIGSGDNAADFTTDTAVGTYTTRELMIAYSRLASREYATQVLTAEQLSGYGFVRVYSLGANVTVGTDGTATVVGDVVYRPVLVGENAGNYTLYSAQWTAPDGLAVGVDEDGFALSGYSLSVQGEIKPIDLGVGAQYVVGRDQSYNSAMLDPQATSDGVVTVTQEQAAAMGISAENYAKLVQEAKNITVTFGEDFFDALVQEGVLEKRDDGKYYAVNAQYASALLPDKADGGNFVVTMTDNTVTFRYFDTAVKEGAAYYLIADEEDYLAWTDNEGGAADYYAIDMMLAADVDFGGKPTAMLAWRDADGNVVGYKGTFDGNGHAFTNAIVDREGSAALFERIDEGATVRNLTVADFVVISTGAASTAAGIAVDNYGTIENCAFEGVLSASALTGGITTANYGVVDGCVSVNRAYVDVGGVAEGIGVDGEVDGETGVSEGVSITESVVGSGEDAVRETVIEKADKTAASWEDAIFTPVISAYVFDERYIKVDGNGLFVTDDFIKLNAVIKLFGWVGADAVTSASQTGYHGIVSIN